MTSSRDRLYQSVQRVPPPLAALVLAALIIGAAWSVVLAPLQPHDEAAHVAYVGYLAESGGIPSPTDGDHPFGADQERATGLFALGALNKNLTARPDWSQLRFKSFERFEKAIGSRERGLGEGPNSIAKNPPLYYAAQAVAWKLTPGGFLDRLSLMRIVSVFLLCLTVVLAWLLASEIFHRALPRTVATGVVALLPMTGYLGGIVNPDIATAAAWTAFLWLSVKMTRTGPSVGRVTVLSLVAAAAVLTHGRNLVILPALALVLITSWAAASTPVRQVLKEAASSAAVVALTALVLRATAAATSNGAGAFGGETNLGNASAFNIRQFFSSIWQFYAPKLSSMEPRLGPSYGFRQFYVEQFLGGTFASNEVYFSPETYDLIQVAFVALFIAFYTVLIVRWPSVKDRWPAAVVCGGTTLLVIAFLHLASYRSLIGGSEDPLITGRYLMPLVSVFGLVAATVVAGISRRLAPVLAGFVLGSLFVGSIGGIGLSLMRFYA